MRLRGGCLNTKVAIRFRDHCKGLHLLAPEEGAKYPRSIPISKDTDRRLGVLARKTLLYLALLVARAGVQPATFALGVRCSMQLSYRATRASVSQPRW